MAKKLITQLPTASGNTLTLTGYTIFEDTVHTYKTTLGELKSFINTDTITGATFSGDTLTFTNVTGGTLSVTGITSTVGPSPVSTYSAFLELDSNGDIFTTLIQNDFDSDFTWSIPSNGVLQVTATTGTPFTPGRTIGFVPPHRQVAAYQYTFKHSTESVVQFELRDFTGTRVLTNPLFNYLFVEIRVYNN